MSTMVLELPHSMLDHKKLRVKHGTGNGIRVTGFGSYLCDWNGGRNIGHYDQYDGSPLRYPDGTTVQEDREGGNKQWRRDAQKLIKDYVGMMNRKKIPFLATMTNTAPISKDNTRQAFGFLNFLADGIEGNGVIVTDPRIENAIRNRYGKKLKYVGSVIRWYNGNNSGMGSYRYLTRHFDQFVVKPEHVIKDDGHVDSDFFISLGEHGRDKAVVMLNYPCQRDCGSAKEHYKLISETAKSYPISSGIDTGRWRCSHKQELMLDNEKIDEVCGMGISNFKLGRNMYALQTIQANFPDLDIFQERPNDFNDL